MNACLRWFIKNLDERKLRKAMNIIVLAGLLFSLLMGLASQTVSVNAATSTFIGLSG
jgi:hypothetical protein